MKKFLIFSFLVFFGAFFSLRVNAQSADCSNPSVLNPPALAQCILDIQKTLDLSINATKPLESELNRLQTQITGIKQRVKVIENDIFVEKANIDTGYKNLDKQEKILERTIRDFYIKSYYNSPIVTFLSATSASEITQLLAYQKATTDQDKVIITNIVLSITDLETKKKNLENEQTSLIALKANLDDQSAKLDKIVSGAKAYQSTLSGQIASLSAKQEEILNAKGGTFTTSVGDVPLADDPNASPNFNPGFSPAFAAFSFGAFTHRNGMSQYGAKGRAEQGQSAEQILSFYYPGSNLNKNYGEPETINVTGYGSMSFEDEYLIGIYEMPSSFPQQALRAQAVAARTYAIRQGGTICATEACQVYKPASGRNDAWTQAVKDTRGWVFEGGPNAQYSSTTGGYSNNSGWDTTSGSRDAWTSGAYEKLAGSPWFYKGWYTQSYSISSNKCGRSNPWLNTEEMSDILNAYLIQNKPGVDNSRITPITTSCWGGNPYSMGEIRDLAGNAGGSVNSISNISVSYSTDGKTANITFSTNKGDISIGGSDFKQIFNLRAPGYISIKSPLFNVEKK